MKMILVDGDVVLYRVGFAAQKTRYEVWTEDEQLVEVCDNAADANALMADYGVDLHKTPMLEVEPVENALHSCKLLLQSIQDKYPDEQVTVYFSCSTADNFRKTFYAQYKNRPARRPEHYAAIKEYMWKKYTCQVDPTLEADDLIAIAAAQYPGSVVVTNDKDMDQIPGLHFDFTKDREYVITEGEAREALEMQTIMGDSTDNIQGISGWGKVKAAQWLASEGTAWDAYQKVYDVPEMAEWQYMLNRALVRLASTEKERRFILDDLARTRTALTRVEAEEASP
jgi:5'-3' exonuclease